MSIENSLLPVFRGPCLLPQRLVRHVMPDCLLLRLSHQPCNQARGLTQSFDCVPGERDASHPPTQTCGSTSSQIFLISCVLATTDSPSWPAFITSLLSPHQETHGPNQHPNPWWTRVLQRDSASPNWSLHPDPIPTGMSRSTSPFSTTPFLATSLLRWERLLTSAAASTSSPIAP